MIKDLHGLVLAGGQSSRMGTNKALIEFHGIPQREYLYSLLGEYCRKVYLSCRTDQDAPEKYNSITDELGIESPLNGILSALRFDHTAAWITVPVDMPLIDNNIIEELISNRDPNALATCFLDSSGKKPEPLLTIWEPEAYKLLEAYYQNGGFSPREFLASHNVRMIKISNPAALTNINSQQDLQNFLNSPQKLA